MEMHAVNSICVFIESIIAKLIANKKQYRYAACNTDGKTCNIDRGERLMLCDVSYRNHQVILQHTLPPIFDE